MGDKLHREIFQLVRQTRSLIEDFANLGIEQISLPSQEMMSKTAADHSPVQADVRETLDQIRADLGECRRCKLCEKRNHIVFGVGNPDARLVLVGEAPGREEDRRGEPFVGEAGRLLDRILFAMGLQRPDVYICNVEKCRPPGNRDPEPDEVAACEPFLKRQLAAISPQVIISLGRVASQALLREQTAISRLRGQWREYQGIPLMPTFHPAYLLRNPTAKREVWEDVKQVMRRLEGPGG
ncbi:uracil-DNA glycosylase [Geothermobacter hydrogeniphilus]|uniref:Type-4 uracil-DNA glycosylase n=1 Tax=Geothermobacter hydrogeniphilus TaxID=1969733 RepID=A0A1X0Y343_9BACT|nr:uracil-DNA glycosylase [Geothermobacter hydrogeniphilus]ORJ59580.1 DNA polymerase [Geothermobacter hydrogeniphilus]